MRWLGKWERLLQILGLLTLGIYVGVRIHGIVLSRAAVQGFESKVSAQQKGMAGAVPPPAPDFSLWSSKRIRDYRESLAAHFSPTIAVLRIPKIQLEVPVLDGTDDVSLNRAVGLIGGTAHPGDAGNVGIAGHRDGFFRGLKDVAVGDVIEIETERDTRRYVIDRIVIVAPSDVSVLAPRNRPSVTLVTCYPFYFVGSAPQRYIVQASVVDTHAANLKTTVGVENAGNSK
jgi:sortase A